MNNINHVAIIMDGNGRWALRQNKERTYGHQHGVENVRNIAIKANALGIKVLTVYAFSTENWKRPAKEVEFLMNLPDFFFNKYIKELMDENIKVDMIGEWSNVPLKTKKVLEKAIETTRNNTGLVLNFAFNYGGKREIVLACQKYIEELKKNPDLEALNEDNFKKYLQSGKYPDVDLMIRTSGEKRLSNFMLYSNAYAEFVFVDEDWPDFTPEIFEKVLNEYANRDRRFGGIK